MSALNKQSRAGRIGIIALCALLACSCRGLPRRDAAAPDGGAPAAAAPVAQPTQSQSAAQATARTAFPVRQVAHWAADGPALEGPALEPATDGPPPRRPATQEPTLAPVVTAQAPQPEPAAPASPPALPDALPAEPMPADSTPFVPAEPPMIIEDNPSAGDDYAPAPMHGPIYQGSIYPGRACQGPGCPACQAAQGCQPLPADLGLREYLCDGGDTKLPVRVLKDWTVLGMDGTDTVAHFDTLDGRTIVEPSNRVCVYAPRFAAVRQITSPSLNETLRTAAGMDHPLPPLINDRVDGPRALLQPVQPAGDIGMKAANALLDRNRGLLAENVLMPLGAANPLKPFENFEIIRRGVYLNSEKPRLHERAEAALVWMTYESVEVMIGERKAVPVESTAAPQAVVQYKLDGKSRLRICKLASTDTAQPGDIVEFTIRFDNVGDERIGNVTIIDSLTTRLEYVEGSQSCTLDHEFFESENEQDSLVLRWEITDPLAVGEGGVIRFQCRVR